MNVRAFVTLGERPGQQRYNGQGHRDRADPQLADQPLAHLAQLLLKSAVVDENALRPGENALALHSEPKKPLSALDDQYAQALLELLDAG